MRRFGDRHPEGDESWKPRETVIPKEKNPYIADKEMTVDLISELIRNENTRDLRLIHNIRQSINDLFSSLSEWSFENKLEFYQKYMRLCDRLIERQKINMIHDKVIVSVGGRFSAGKSKFINDISGIKTLLPASTRPTTSIPTYIIKSDDDKITANSIWGYEQVLTEDALEALSHRMDEAFGAEEGRKTGFAPFIESIVVESASYKLPENIVLLDTPGYTKYDGDINAKRGISDRKRTQEQLSKTDHLIWLVDIDGGTITEEDLRFIESLELNTPILIVLTKADLKPLPQVREIIDHVKRAVQNAAFDCFGVTAYSSYDHIEYTDKLISVYLDHCAESDTKIYQIIEEFKKLGNEMRESILKTQREEKKTTDVLLKAITESEKVLEVSSMAKLWGQYNQEAYMLSKCIDNFDRKSAYLNNEIEKYIRS